MGIEVQKPEEEPGRPPEKAEVKATAESSLSKIFAYLKDDKAPDQQIVDAKKELFRHKSAVRLVQRQSYVILALIFLIILLMPVVAPINEYIARRTDGAKKPLASLYSPNLTDRAVLSWAASSITEIMTFGFGDIDARLLSQKNKFTEEGWVSFVIAAYDKDLVNRFKSQQLVLTTAPIDVPVVVSKGIDTDGEYKWIVEMPVIMTYTTNNNARNRNKQIIRLTIVRVPAYQSISGIAIKNWMVM